MKKLFSCYVTFAVLITVCDSCELGLCSFKPLWSSQLVCIPSGGSLLVHIFSTVSTFLLRFELCQGSRGSIRLVLTCSCIGKLRGRWQLGHPLTLQVGEEVPPESCSHSKVVLSSCCWGTAGTAVHAPGETQTQGY